jgi:hypothetical protein
MRNDARVERAGDDGPDQIALQSTQTQLPREQVHGGDISTIWIGHIQAPQLGARCTFGSGANPDGSLVHLPQMALDSHDCPRRAQRVSPYPT